MGVSDSTVNPLKSKKSEANENSFNSSKISINAKIKNKKIDHLLKSNQKSNNLLPKALMTKHILKRKYQKKCAKKESKLSKTLEKNLKEKNDNKNNFYKKKHIISMNKSESHYSANKCYALKFKAKKKLTAKNNGGNYSNKKENKSVLLTNNNSNNSKNYTKKIISNIQLNKFKTGEVLDNNNRNLSNQRNQRNFNKIKLNNTNSKTNKFSKNIINSTNALNSKAFDAHKSFSRISSLSTNSNNNNKSLKQKKNFMNNDLQNIFKLNNNLDKNNILYIIDDRIKEKNLTTNSEEFYSYDTDYDNTIKLNSNNKNKIFTELLKLKERKWIEELSELSNILCKKREHLIINNNFYSLIRQIIMLYEHFNWIINSIGFYFKSLLYDNNKENFDQNIINEINLPKIDSEIWFSGFVWKGIFIRIESNLNSKKIKTEIKSLNYYFLDYLLLLNKFNGNNFEVGNLTYEKSKVLLSNNIIFPLIGYVEINSFILYASNIIDIGDIKNDNNLFNEICNKIKLSNGTIELSSNLKNNLNNIIKNSLNKDIINENIDIKIKTLNIKSETTNDTSNISGFFDKFNIEDFNNSRLFNDIQEYNLIKVKTGKYMLLNIGELIPKLFETNFENNIYKVNFYATVNKEKKYYTLNYNQLLNISLNDCIESKEKKSDNKIKLNSPKEVIENIYNLYYSPNLKYKNIIIGNIYFRIIYLNTENKIKNRKEKTFVDYLYNNDNILKNNIPFIKKVSKKNNSNKKISSNAFNSSDDDEYEDENEDEIGDNNEKKNSNKSINDYCTSNNNSNNLKDKIKTFVKEPYVILYDLIEPIKLDYSLIKSHKQKKNQKEEVITNLFYLRTNYIAYFISWCQLFNKNSFNIKKYSDLKFTMKKYGINQNLLFFSLFYINNEEITDIIKIHLLVKCFKFIYNKKDNENIFENLKNNLSIYKIQNTNNILNSLKDNTLSDNLKSKIIFYIKSILFPNELLPIGQDLFEYIFEQLNFYSNVLFLKYKLIDDYLSLGLLNLKSQKENNVLEYQSTKDFLKEIILISRKKPFLFISELEYKLNFIIDPFVKFKSSLSIESMSHQLDVVHVSLRDNILFSFINPIEISGLILCNIIDINDSLYIKNLSNSDTKIDNNPDLIKTTVINTKINIFSSLYNNNSKSKSNDKILICGNTKNVIKNGSEKTMDESELSKNQTSNITTNQDIANIKKIYTPGIITNLYTENIKQNLNSNSNTSIGSNKNMIKMKQKELKTNFFINLPANCYKVKYAYEEEFNNKNICNNNIYEHLKNKYTLSNSKIIHKWLLINKIIFRKIYSTNSNCEYAILKSYIYFFLISLYIDKKCVNDTKRIIHKIKNIFKSKQYELSLNELAVINFCQSMSNEQYIGSEEFSSKCVMLLLMNYGDPRGRNNDSHGALQYPLWKIARKTYKLEQPIINENFKEMYRSLDYFDSKKNEIKNISNYKKNNVNFLNNIYSNLDKILLLNNISKNNNINENKEGENLINIGDESLFFMDNNLDEKPDFYFLNKDLTDKNLSLTTNIFTDNLNIDKFIIKNFNFPSVTKSINVNQSFLSKEFIIYIFKEIQSLLMSRNIIYTQDYINKIISNDVFTTKEKLSDEDIDINNINETPLKKANNFSKNNIEKIDNSTKDLTSFSSKSNKLYYNDKKNNKSTQYLSRKNNINNNVNHLNSISSNPTSQILNVSYNNTKTISGNKFNSNKINSYKVKNKNVFSHFLYNELLQKLSYKDNLPSGIVISFGNNTHNETSHDRYEKLTFPRVIFKLKNEIITKIYSGWEHNLVLNNKKEIFSFGHNQSFQCGLNNNDQSYENINDPTNITKINNIKANKISCGNEHSLILSTDNNVYAFGSNEDGVLGLKNKTIKSYKPIKINFGEYDQKIKNISAGTVHNLALTNDGKIFSWGSAQGGQLGLSEKFLITHKNFTKNLYVYKPTIISPQIFKNSEIIKISCGEAHSVVLTNNGEVYSWGFGSNGQLGLGFCEDIFEPGTGLSKCRKFEPEIINNFKNNKIKDVQCGKTFTMFINNYKNLYACGINDLSQLGLKEMPTKENLFNPEMQCDDVIFPIYVDCLMNKKVEKIACGEGHCLALINEDNSNVKSVWSWGNNKFGQLGHGSIYKTSLPKKIDYLLEYKTNIFDEISCGGFHSMCLMKSKCNLDWIENDYKNIICELIDEIEV